MSIEGIARTIVVLLAGLVVVILGWWLFVDVPTDTTDLLGIVLVLLLVPFGFRTGNRIANSIIPEYNVASVAVEGPITRDGADSFPPSKPGKPGADDIVDLVDRADDDSNVDALIVECNTPGGEVVPSDDIRLAVERFDGPTIAYATDVCASGGYWIASGCDELWARDGSIVGSIGVRGSRITAGDLLDRLGIEYEQLAAGEYKEAGVPLKDLESDERAYLQGIVDEYYDKFVETVADGRKLDPADIRETEARVYLGSTAHEMGLVDDIGTRSAVEDRLETLLDESVSVAEFEPEVGITSRLRLSAERIAYAAGMGVATHLVDDDGFRLRLD